ncbi:MAG: alanine racemase [Gemmobacter sp.]
MAQAELTIDLDAVAANWRALAGRAAHGARTGAGVTADGYGLGAAEVARALVRAGARQFFVAQAAEGLALRAALGAVPDIFVLSGHMEGATAAIAEARLVPALNSIEQMTRHFAALPGHPFAVQIDTGMARLGLPPDHWRAVAGTILPERPLLLMSHLACADEPAHSMNAQQLSLFHTLTVGTGIARSLAATGGILLGHPYHFELTRPGIGLYGGAPFAQARAVVALDLPVIQTRVIAPGTPVGYGASWIAPRESVIATVSAGYADGLPRALGGPRAEGAGFALWAGGQRCPVVGRVSMDLITVDVTDLDEVPETLAVLGPGQGQGVDALAALAGTIGYEILTSLGARYARRHLGGG